MKVNSNYIYCKEFAEKKHFRLSEVKQGITWEMVKMRKQVLYRYILHNDLEIDEVN